MAHRFEMLFSRASARSLDLKQLAGEASKEIPPSNWRRKQFMEELYGAPMQDTVKGKQSRTTRRVEYSHAELGATLAYAGVQGSEFLAAMYSFGLDSAVRGSLYRDLREEAAKIAHIERWPERIPGTNGSLHHYEDELTALVLDADWAKALFHLAQSRHNVNLYALMLDVSEEIWQAKVMPKYVRILRPFEIWKSDASRRVDWKLKEDFGRLDRTGLDMDDERAFA